MRQVDKYTGRRYEQISSHPAVGVTVIQRSLAERTPLGDLGPQGDRDDEELRCIQRYESNCFAGIAPVTVAVFLCFLAASMPLAALPLEMGGHLQASPTTIGMVIGLQSLVTVLTRHQAGTLCDQRGPRFAAMVGLPLAACSGMAYLVAGLPSVAGLSIALLLLGRILMGLGESLFLTGLMSWGIARIGAAKTGKVMSWSGIAIYAHSASARRSALPILKTNREPLSAVRRADSCSK